MILPFTDCFGETILPKGWKLNEAGENPTLEEMVLLILIGTTQRILMHVMTMLTKLTCALKVTFCGESRSY